MATLTAEQIEQKKQLLADKLNQMKALSEELEGAGIKELSDEELENVTGGLLIFDLLKSMFSSKPEIVKTLVEITKVVLDAKKKYNK